jgi:hypothetical protein
MEAVQSDPAEERPSSRQILHTPDPRQTTTITELGIGRGSDPDWWRKAIAEAPTRPTSPTEHQHSSAED